MRTQIILSDNVLRGEEALNGTHLTSYRGFKLPVSYQDLYGIFGAPSFLGDKESDIDFEWVLQIDNQVYTVYRTWGSDHFRIGGHPNTNCVGLYRIITDLVESKSKGYDI